MFYYICVLASFWLTSKCCFIWCLPCENHEPSHVQQLHNWFFFTSVFRVILFCCFPSFTMSSSKSCLLGVGWFLNRKQMLISSTYDIRCSETCETCLCMQFIRQLSTLFLAVPISLSILLSVFLFIGAFSFFNSSSNIHNRLLYKI